MSRIAVEEVLELPKVNGGHIFNSPEFNSLKPATQKFFVLSDDAKPVCRLAFTLVENKAISGINATYGSVDFNTSSAENLSYFLQEVISKLRAEGNSEIHIRHWPSFYRDELVESGIFENPGFTILHKEVNQHLRISELKFEERIRYNERKKLNQGISKGYRFKQLSVDSLPEVYKLVQNTRDRKGFPVSMSLPDLSATFSKLPDNYLLFGLFDENVLIAASVSIRITDKILYNFYHADDVKYRSTSPLVMLIKYIYEYCQLNEIDFLDFGISSDKGVLNEGLFTFKKNLGCETSEKITYSLQND